MKDNKIKFNMNFEYNGEEPELNINIKIPIINIENVFANTLIKKMNINKYENQTTKDVLNNNEYKSLNETSWKDIKSAFENGTAPWKVGDKKTIKMKTIFGDQNATADYNIILVDVCQRYDCKNNKKSFAVFEFENLFDQSYNIGTYSEDLSWYNSNIRDVMNKIFDEKIPSDLREVITEVNLNSYDKNKSITDSYDKLFIPSKQEIIKTNDYNCFNYHEDNNKLKLIKRINKDNSAPSWYWLRNFSNTDFIYVNENGATDLGGLGYNYIKRYRDGGVLICFAL